MQVLCTSIKSLLADLTVLRFVTTVWARITQNSYLHEFCAQVSQNRVPSWFDRSTAYYNCMSKNVTKLISPRVLCTSITNRVLIRTVESKMWFDGLLQLYEQKCHKTHISASSVHKYRCKSVTNCVFSWFDFLWLITVWSKMSQNSYLRQLCAQVSQVVFLADWPRLFTNCMSKNITKLLSPRVLCTSIKNRVLSWFDRLTAYNKYHKWNVIISPRVLCTSIKNRVCSWFDKNVTKLIFSVPRILFYGLLQWAKMSQIISQPVLCTWYHRVVFLADLTVLRLITVSAKLSQNSYLREFCAQVSKIVYLAEHDLLQMCHKTHISASSVHKYHKSLIWLFIAYKNCMTKKSKNSYLREFCAQVSKIVFVADLTVLRLTTCMSKNEKFISVLFTSVKNRVFSWFERFITFLKFCAQEFCTVLCKCHKLCF